MQSVSSWDWQPGKRVVVDSIVCTDDHEWQEEPYVSPDGEKVAAVVCLGEEEFSLSVNGTPWESRFEKAWHPCFSPDGRLTVVAMADMEWSIAVDGELWEETYDYIWGTMFNEDGSGIAAPIQSGAQYGVSVNGVAWETLFANANHPVISPDGKSSAAVVQTREMGQAEISVFQQGIFSVAVNGEVWNDTFVNCWTPVFDAQSKSVACQARSTLYDYTIVVDGKAWSKFYQCVWSPAFNPATGDVVAPVRMGGAWGMAKNGEILWKPKYTQCWQQQFSPDGSKLWAIVAPRFGQFTVAWNDIAWEPTFPVVVDLSLSPDGQRAAALGNNDNTDFQVMVEGKVWPGKYDMAWKPVFSGDGSKVAVHVEKAGRHTVLLDGKPYKEDFDRAWQPVFSPDGSKVLVKGLKDGKLVRIVADVNDFQPRGTNMNAFYDFITGPLAWISFAVFVFGGAYKILYMWTLAKKKEGSSLAYMSWGYSLRSIINWLIPFNALGWKANPIMTVVTFLFHICLLAVPIFLMGHVALWELWQGIGWATLPDTVADTMTVIVIVLGAYYAYRRLFREEIKFVTTGYDWVVLIIAVAPFVTGFLAYHQIFNYKLMIILHILSGEIWLMAIPFTRLSHMLLAVFSRAYIGSEFGGVRHVKDW